LGLELGTNFIPKMRSFPKFQKISKLKLKRVNVTQFLNEITFNEESYGYDPHFDAENAITVMAVENLTCVLPRDRLAQGIHAKF
jgi:hypothetical protein